ncbi:MAG: type II secretion system F family protein [Candidatus Woykebacteria bacterium]
MEQFKYVVRDLKGATKEGLIEAATTRAAASILHDRGYVVVSIEANKAGISSFSFFGGVKIGDIANFTRQLATMITSGLPLTDSLVILQKQTEKEKFREVIKEIAEDIQGGSTFADSLSKHSGVFSIAYINIVRAGESSGTLDQVLLNLANTLEKDREFQSKVKGAFVYPIIIMVAMTMVAVIILIFVVPKLTELYTDLDISLPLPTVILIFVSDFMIRFWWLVIILGVVGFSALRRYRKTPQGSLVIDKLLLKVPIFGKLNRDSSLTELTRTLGALVGAGVPILEALKISGNVASNAIHRQAISRATTLVEKGAQLSKAISQDQTFPPLMPQMIAVGEETGKMDEVLNKVSTYYELEVEHQVKNLTTALEPIIMIVLGIMVAGLVISIILPIYNITSAF